MFIDSNTNLVVVKEQPSKRYLDRQTRIEETELLKKVLGKLPLSYFTAEQLRPLIILFTDGHAYQTLTPEEITDLRQIAEDADLL